LTCRVPHSTLFPYTTLFRSTGVYLLVDTSGSYNRQLNKAEQIVLYALSRLQPLDSIAVARIDAGSFSEKNIIAKASFDDRPSSTDRKSTRLNSSHVSISYAV